MSCTFRHMRSTAREEASLATTDWSPGTSRAKRMERRPEAARPSSTRRPSCWSNQGAPLTWIPPSSAGPQGAPTTHFLQLSRLRSLPSSITGGLSGRHLLCSGHTSQISPTAAVRGWSPGARLAPSFSSAFSSSCSDKSTTTFCTSFSPGTLTAATQKHKSGDSKAPSERPPPISQETEDSGEENLSQSPWGKPKGNKPRACRVAGAFRNFKGKGAGQEESSV